MTVMKIDWHGFIEHAVKSYPYESCGFLFSDKPYSPGEKWHVFIVENISNSPLFEWRPDKKDMLRVKAKAIRMGLTKIGNVHTHPLKPPGNDYNLDIHEDMVNPSEMDLRFARKHNDIIRGILVIGAKAVYDCRFHDKFGNRIGIVVTNE